MVHHLVLDNCERQQVRPDIVLTSTSWDFMLNSTKINHNIMTICPKPITDIYPLKDVICIPMEHPVSWRVVLTRMQKESYSEIESYIMDTLVQSFIRQ